MEQYLPKHTERILFRDKPAMLVSAALLWASQASQRYDMPIYLMTMTSYQRSNVLSHWHTALLSGSETSSGDGGFRRQPHAQTSL